MNKLASFVGLFAGAVSAFASQADLDRATTLYQRTEYQSAVQVLANLNDKAAEEYFVLGQSHYMLGDFKKASDSFERAVALAPGNSFYYNWLGKAFGRRAETAFPTNAPGLASKSRAAMEKAVVLNPKNREALGDLFEFYLQAPGFLGGGLDKARRIANMLSQLDQAEGDYAQARLAENKKEFHSAEEHLRRAAAIAPAQVGRLLDLAKFLAQQGRFDESDKTFEQASKAAPKAPKVLFARADTYIKTNRNLDTAKELLHEYLTSSLSPDDPSRQDAQKLLKKVSGS